MMNTTRTSALEASEMLEAALEQMDGILAGTRLDSPQQTKSHYTNGYINGHHATPPINYSSGARSATMAQTPKTPSSPQLPILGATRVQVGRLTNMLDDMKVITDSMVDRQEVLQHLPDDQVDYLMTLVKDTRPLAKDTRPLVKDTRPLARDTRPLANGFSSESGCESGAEGPNGSDTLLLRVSVLTEQVQSQQDKIHDLELHLEDHQGKLAVTEEMLQKEVLGKTALETQKIDLMAEVSELKIKLASAEAETKDYEEKLWMAQRQMDDLRSLLTDKDCEITELKIRLAKTDALISTSPSLYSNCSTESEVDRLKRTIESLVGANNDKDTKINDLHRALRRYKNLDQSLASQRREPLSSVGGDDEQSDGSSTHSEQNKEQNMPTALNGNRFDNRLPLPHATSTPDSLRYQPGILPSPPSTIHSSPTPPKSPSSNGNFLQMDDFTPSRTPPSKPPRHYNHNDTNAIRAESGNHGQVSYPASPLGPITPPRSPATKALVLDPAGPHATLIVPGDSSTLPPPTRRKRQMVKEEDDVSMSRIKDERAQQFKAMQTSTETGKRKKGIKKIFGKPKLKRSNSQEEMMDDDEKLGEFRRGGIRATAGGRLGWSKDMINTNDLVVPFARWDSERLCMWLHELGLSMYSTECRRNIKTGEQMLKVNAKDLEQDLGIKNPLHKKKLFLALKTRAYETSRVDKMHRLDHNWVAKWLDDIGLPQYKDSFMEGRVDGRMLHFLTVEDLLHLKVSSSLHHYSIRRAVQVLRINAFNPDCLRRRPDEQGDLEDAAEQVQLWTNHRVMEWLRSIDLSEYAPNLRGSGVHGALMVLEPAFSAELFAAILSIAQNKTLLRRHLKTHFTSLIGPTVQQTKREYEATSGNAPLTPNMKIKSRKHGLFNKRSKSDTEFDQYICPMDLQSSKLHWTRNGSSNYTSDSDDKNKEEKGTKAFATDVHILTNMLERERFLSDDTIPATDV